MWKDRRDAVKITNGHSIPDVTTINCMCNFVAKIGFEMGWGKDSRPVCVQKLSIAGYK